MTAMRTITRLGSVLVSTCLAAAGARGQAWNAEFDFGAAAEGYTKHAYALSGWVDRKGEVRNGGLGCSAYASVVLHRMRYGDAWLEHFDWRLHQKRPSGVATAFSLARGPRLSRDELMDPAATERLVAAGRLVENQLYLFDIEIGEPGDKGYGGHVGFLRVRDRGRLVQSHYSGMRPYQGLATGDFRDWYRRSKYRAASVQLHLVPPHRAAAHDPQPPKRTQRTQRPKPERVRPSPSAEAPATPWRSKLDLARAAKGFTGQAYALSGWVDRKGEVRNGGLGCSAYASVVLHRMRYGDAWLENFDWRLHQKRPSGVAAAFSLVRGPRLSRDEVMDPAAIERLVAAGRLVENQVYLFDLEIGEPGKKGYGGHVGFLRVRDRGRLVQSHYSGMRPYEGLATGDFRDWYRRSKYRAAPVQLHLVPPHVERR